MAAVGLAFSFYRRSVTSSKRLQEVLAETTDVPNPSPSAMPPGHTSGGIEFRNLRFRFPGTTRDVIDGITLQIRPGERVAFVGAIGSGKSALLGLLPRLYPVERGMLFIDGIDINDWPIDDLRRQVGYVSQEVFLFSETVVENVAFGLGDWATRSDDLAAVQRAAELAAVHEEVLGLAQSYETRLGERGVNLSGGQKQRLTIARALAKEPSILVLDDALSSVDVRTEERILTSLRHRPGRNTEIVAAHRISTIQDADRIVVLIDGKIAQIGTHRELITVTDGLYWRFYEQQRLREDLERYMELEGELS
jgi:ATP-binding cassette subfamily B protein